MAWAIITIYTSKCAQMDPQQLPKTSKFYSRFKKCDIEKTLGGGGYHPALGSLKAKMAMASKEHLLLKCLFQFVHCVLLMFYVYRALLVMLTAGYVGYA